MAKIIGTSLFYKETKAEESEMIFLMSYRE